MKDRTSHRALVVLLAGLVAGGIAGWSLAGGDSGDHVADRGPATPLARLAALGFPAPGLLESLGAVLGRPAATSADGEYLFLPHRRKVWVVHQKSGRFAYYDFRDTEEKAYDRSRVATLDSRTFPPQDTIFMLSDRNLTDVFWVCNKRTGDVQLWVPRAGGEIEKLEPIATSIDLMERRGS